MVPGGDVSDAGPADESLAPATPEWVRQQVNGCEGPAFAMSPDRRVLAANSGGQDLLDRMTGDSQKILNQDVSVCLGGRKPVQGQLRVPGEEMELIFDTTYLPVGGAESGGGNEFVLALCRDVTLDYHFRQALVASRRLFKDLVGCSSDFAWETRPDGTFSYVSQRGAIGYTAIELDRRVARELIQSDVGFDGAGAFNPFETREDVTDEEIRLIGRDGQIAVMRVSCVPVYSRKRQWLGARGVCRDVTEIRAQDEALAHARERERLMQNIVRSIHSELLPNEMLSVAVDAVSEEMETPDCWIVKAGTGGQIMACAGRSRPTDFQEIAQSGEFDRSDIGEAWFELEMGDLSLLCVPCGYGTSTKGYLIVGKPIEFGQWSDEDHDLLANIGNHVGVVISQAEFLQQLEELSRIDDLTRLLNRRAFVDEVSRRLSHAQRMGRPAALLYLDLDNFKAVNDIRGHADGDFVLRSFSKTLLETSRAADYAGRIGGDEFVLWLEETTEAGAHDKAQSLLDQFSELKEFSGSPDKPLGVSIGIALAEPGQELDLEDLFAIADHAMYKVKRSGKSSFAVARWEELQDKDETGS